MPSKMAAAAASMHPPYHDLTYYAKKIHLWAQVTGTHRRTRTRPVIHRASRDPADPDGSGSPFSR